MCNAVSMCGNDELLRMKVSAWRSQFSFYFSFFVIVVVFLSLLVYIAQVVIQLVTVAHQERTQFLFFFFVFCTRNNLKIQNRKRGKKRRERRIAKFERIIAASLLFYSIDIVLNDANDVDSFNCDGKRIINHANDTNRSNRNRFFFLVISFLHRMPWLPLVIT